MGYLPINLSNSKPASDLNYNPGEYALEIQSVTPKPTKDGAGYRLEVKTKILMGPGLDTSSAGKPFTHGYALSEKALPFVHRFVLAAGVTQQLLDQNGGQIAEEWFPGLKYMCNIAKDGQYYVVSRERPISEWTYGGIAGVGQSHAGPAMQMAPQPAMAPQGYQTQWQQSQIATPQPVPAQQGFAPQGGFVPAQQQYAAPGNGVGQQQQMAPAQGGFMPAPAPFQKG